MSSTVGMRYASGAVVAINANLDIRKTGFRPKRIKVENLTNGVKVDWHEGLVEGSNVKTVAAGDRTVVTSAVAPLDADSAGNAGFRIPALADVNDTTTEDLLWEAWG